MVFSLQDPVTIERLFRDAGFEHVSVRTHTRSLRLPAARDFLWQYAHCTPLTAMLSKLDAARRAAFEDEVVERWASWSDENGMTYEQGMHVANARR
jgi:hypothetical protein